MPPSSKKQANWMRAMLTRRLVTGKGGLITKLPQPPVPPDESATVDERGYVSAPTISKKTTKGWLDAFDTE